MDLAQIIADAVLPYKVEVVFHKVEGERFVDEERDIAVMTYMGGSPGDFVEGVVLCAVNKVHAFDDTIIVKIKETVGKRVFEYEFHVREDNTLGDAMVAKSDAARIAYREGMKKGV